MNSHSLDTVTLFVNDASKYGLTPEVVLTALLYIKENPDKDIEDAISYGFYEWIK